MSVVFVGLISMHSRPECLMHRTHTTQRHNECQWKLQLCNDREKPWRFHENHWKMIHQRNDLCWTNPHGSIKSRMEATVKGTTLQFAKCRKVTFPICEFTFHSHFSFWTKNSTKIMFIYPKNNSLDSQAWMRAFASTNSSTMLRLKWRSSSFVHFVFNGTTLWCLRARYGLD